MNYKYLTIWKKDGSINAILSEDLENFKGLDGWELNSVFHGIEINNIKGQFVKETKLRYLGESGTDTKLD